MGFSGPRLSECPLRFSFGNLSRSVAIFQESGADRVCCPRSCPSSLLNGIFREIFLGEKRKLFEGIKAESSIQVVHFKSLAVVCC